MTKDVALRDGTKGFRFRSPLLEEFIYVTGVELEYSFPKKNNYVKLGFFLWSPPPLSGYFASSILVPQLLPSKTKPSSLSATDDGRPCSSGALLGS